MILDLLLLLLLLLLENAGHRGRCQHVVLPGETLFLRSLLHLRLLFAHRR